MKDAFGVEISKRKEQKKSVLREAAIAGGVAGAAAVPTTQLFSSEFRPKRMERPGGMSHNFHAFVQDKGKTTYSDKYLKVKNMAENGSTASERAAFKAKLSGMKGGEKKAKLGWRLAAKTFNTPRKATIGILGGLTAASAGVSAAQAAGNTALENRAIDQRAKKERARARKKLQAKS